MSAAAELCKHCESCPGVSDLGLCGDCDALGGIRLLYEKTRGLTAEREDRLRLLAERARRRLPLFDDLPEEGAMNVAPLAPSVTAPRSVP
jgi:hypothetical protein